MMNSIIIKAASSPQALDEADFAELRRVCRDYPASAVAPALLLKYADSMLSDAEREDYRARVALYSGDRASVISAIDPSGKGFASFYPPEPEVRRPSTDSAIDTFLETYGHQSPEEDALLERMIFNPVPDYGEQLARAAAPSPAPGEQGGQDSLIDAFLSKSTETPSAGEPVPVSRTTPAPAPPPPPKSAPEPSQSSLLSESLAKIFIKQGRYERAYEIITNLSLNYPKKSIYFADQLRFLEKLIINQRCGERKSDRK